jgi:capsular exopolysaccharide synthesis family protein
MAKEVLPVLGSAPAEEAGDALNLREIWRALARRKLAFLAAIALITGGAFLYCLQQTPLYTAETLIHIQNRDADVVELTAVVEELTADPPTIESEIERISSRAFLRRVVDALDLTADPEFNPGAGRTEGGSLLDLVNPSYYLPAGWFRALTEERELSVIRESLAPTTIEMNRVIARLIKAIRVAQVGRSYVIELAVTTADPTKAARIANTMAQAYLETQLETKYAAGKRAIDWLSKRVEELRGQVLAAEARIVEYRAANNIVATDAGNPASLQLSQLNTQLALSQAQRAEAEARLTQARSVFGAAGIEAAAKVLSSPLMAELRVQETELLRRRSELSAEYGLRHPLMVNLQGELDSLHGKMADEVRRIIQDLENEVAVARAREQELQGSLAKVQSGATTIELAEVELRNLTRGAETNRKLLETFQTRFSQILQQQELQESDARIMSPADIPTVPSHPQTELITALALLGSLALGGLLVFLLERWDADYGFRSAEEIRALGLKALALVPDLSRRETDGIEAEDYILERPNSAYAEALQRIRTSLFLSSSERAPRTLLVTSSVPLEGKSTIATALARQSARSGLKVILVDADLRRPRLHEVMGLPNQNGLTEVLAGKANPETAIRRDEKSDLDFLPAGIGALSPPDLFRSSTMRVLLEEMADYYDLVIIDSPPVAAVSDSFTLSGIVDQAIYVIRWEQTPRNVALAGIRQLLESGGNLAGVVLSRVDVKRHAQYGYADSGQYQGAYQKYYTN